jgi:hypothetical protein
MIDASSGESEAKRSEDGLSNGNDFDDTGVAVSEFPNVINKLNNAAANGVEEANEEEDGNGVGIGVDDVASAEGVRGDNWAPGAVDNGVAADVAGVVTAAVARPRGRGPGRSCAPQPAEVAGIVRAPPVGVAAASAAAAAKAWAGADGQNGATCRGRGQCGCLWFRC